MVVLIDCCMEGGIDVREGLMDGGSEGWRDGGKEGGIDGGDVGID